jgi:hypothetical protein
MAVGRADRNHVLSIAGIGDAECGVALEQAIARLEALIARVPGGGYHDHTARDEALGFVANWRAPTSIVADVMLDRKT